MRRGKIQWKQLLSFKMYAFIFTLAILSAFTLALGLWVPAITKLKKLREKRLLHCILLTFIAHQVGYVAQK